MLVDGRPQVGGTTEVKGLAPGDEISVIFDDEGGREVHSLLYLPEQFPFFTTPVHQPGVAPGDVALTLALMNHPGLEFEVIVDRNGVPALVRAIPGNSSDLKRQPNGNLSVYRDLQDGSGARLLELTDGYRVLARHRTVGLGDPVNSHDSILLPNGHQVLLAYEYNPGTDLVDAVIQEVDADGAVVFQWDSSDLLGESLRYGGGAGRDYAHVNTVQVMSDGHFLASFRHFSAVLKIARYDDPPYVAGDVIWQLGGKHSDFEFVDDPYPGGPCAQHTAYEQPDGHIVIFDNGSGGNDTFPALCIDPLDRTGPPIGRPVTRVTEYALDPEAGTAELVWSWDSGRFMFYAGSAQRLPNGNTLTGWAGGSRPAVAEEVSPTGETLWQLQDRAAAEGESTWWTTYRAALVQLPDAIRPQIAVTVPQEGATYTQGSTVVADYTCTDRGGSSLSSCTGSTAPGEPLDTTTPGPHALTVTAEDGDGNVRTLRSSYEVAGHPGDLAIREVPGGAWRGVDVVGNEPLRVRLSRDERRGTLKVRLRNTGHEPERFRLRGRPGDRHFKVRYLQGGADVTDRLVGRALRTRLMDPGERLVLRVKVRRMPAADPGDRHPLRVTAVPVHDRSGLDRVQAVLRAVR